LAIIIFSVIEASVVGQTGWLSFNAIQPDLNNAFKVKTADSEEKTQCSELMEITFRTKEMV